MYVYIYCIVVFFKKTNIYHIYIYDYHIMSLYILNTCIYYFTDTYVYTYTVLYIYMTSYAIIYGM